MSISSKECLNHGNPKGMVNMIQYSALFQEGGYIYCEAYCDGVSNVKLTHEEYKSWKQDKVEV